MPATTGRCEDIFFSYCRNFNREIFGFFVLCTVFNTALSAASQIVSEGAGIEPRTVATSALAVRSSNHSARFHPLLD
jgi:hypothetical protein